MGRIEDLAKGYQSHIALPWQRNLAGAQRTIFVVYPKGDERRLRAKLDLFEMATIDAGHKWKLLDLTSMFACWMSKMEYREGYFDEPQDLAMKLRSDFVHFVADKIRQALTDDDVGEDTAVAVYGVASLYGFTRASMVLKEIEKDIPGRLVLFFPGDYDNNNYRLLDARDGWNYLAVPITLHNGANSL